MRRAVDISAVMLTFVVAACGAISNNDRVAAQRGDAGHDRDAAMSVADAGRTRVNPPIEGGSWATLPTCKPGPEALALSVTGEAEAYQTYAPTNALVQSFVAPRSGFLTRVDVALARCHATPSDRVMVSVYGAPGSSVVAERSLAYLPADCEATTLPHVAFDLRADCGHVEAGKRYSVVVYSSLGPATSEAPGYRFGFFRGDVYPDGELEMFQGNVIDSFGTVADLAIRVYISE